MKVGVIYKWLSYPRRIIPVSRPEALQSLEDLSYPPLLPIMAKHTFFQTLSVILLTSIAVLYQKLRLMLIGGIMLLLIRQEKALNSRMKSVLTPSENYRFSPLSDASILGNYYVSSRKM